MSDRASTGSPWACSGEKYVAVPSTVAVWVRESEVVARAIPKSMTFTSPVVVSMMFPGFTSRWTIPARWANDRASATPRAISTARSGMRGAPSRSIWESVLPWTYSMTMKCVPSSDPVSNTLTTLGWLRAAADWASRRKRVTNELSRANRSDRIFTAMRRPRTRSVPTYTSAIPPRPSTLPSS